MDDADIEALRALCEAATPGPWSTSGVSTVRSADDSMVATFVDYERHEADAEFMAAVRNALPALLDELARLRRIEIETAQ